MKRLTRHTVVRAGLVIVLTGGAAAALAGYSGSAGRAIHRAEGAAPSAPPTPRETPTTTRPALRPPSPQKFASATSAAENVLAPITGQLGGLTNIINQIADNPDAPLTRDQTGFLDDLNRRTESWNNYVGNIDNANTMWDDANRSIEYQRNEQRLHDAMSNTIDNINYEVGMINSYPDTWDHNLMLVAMPDAASQSHHSVVAPAQAVSQ